VKILMFGRGAIATLYGWALEKAGHEVEFYVRPGRAAEYGDSIHLDLLDARRRVRGERVIEQWPVTYRETLDADDGFDLIVVSVSHEKLPEALSFLAPRLGLAKILIFGNVWVDPLELVRGLPTDQVAWGFPQGGGAFPDDGVLWAGLLPTVIFGTFASPPTAAEQSVRQAFRQAGFKIQEKTDFRSWLWIHFIVDAGLHSQGVRLGSLSNLVGSRADNREAFLAGRELIPVLEARGVDLRRNRAALMLLRAPAWLTSSGLAWATKHTAIGHLAFAAHSNADAEEPRAICRDALAEARRLNIAAPRLAAAERYFSLQGKPRE
jgi:2-dehydropantoate 2-reductase